MSPHIIIFSVADKNTQSNIGRFSAHDKWQIVSTVLLSIARFFGDLAHFNRPGFPGDQYSGAFHQY
jgi:hypothetical protein